MFVCRSGWVKVKRNRGIDIVDAGVERGMENGFCLGLGDVPATRSATELHGTVAQHGDL
jgi:hypothetical protein